MKNVLSVAGSDSSGGAGIQADVKTMCAFGVYGMTAITALTAQNTQSVLDVREADAAMVASQMRAVFLDIRVDAVKVGMVSNALVAEAVRAGLVGFKARNIVVDPVMVSKSGCRLLRDDAVDALRALCAIADVVTPNIGEAEVLSGFSIHNEDDMRRAAQTIAEGGAKAVLVKGGHLLAGDATDVLFCAQGGGFSVLRAARIATKNTHGTGCTLSSAIACRLALGDGTAEAVRAAKAYITRAIADGYALGGGHGPVGHLRELYRRAGLEAAV